MTGTTDPGAIELLLAERAVVQRLYTYCLALDIGDEQSLVDCFTNHGVFEAIGRDGTPLFAATGRAEIQSFARGHTRPPVQHHQHCVVQPMVVVHSPTRASCTSRLLVVLDRDEAPALRAFGTYEDTLERDQDGTWRIRHRTARVVSIDRSLPTLAYGMPTSP